MTAPNIKNPNSITGVTTSVGIGTTVITGILTNTSNSNQVYKINSIFASNITGSATPSSVNITLTILRNGTDRCLANTIVVPANSTQVLSDKNTYFYLEENVGIRAQASIANGIDITIGYEVIT